MSEGEDRAMDGSGSCEALQVKEKRQEEEELKEEDGDEGEVEAEEEVSQLGELQEQAGLPSSQPEVELREAKLESQVAASSSASASALSDKDRCYSGLQEGLEVKTQMGAALKEQVGLLHEEVSASVIERSAEILAQDQHQSSECPTPMSTLSPTSVTQPLSSAPSSTLLEPKASLPRVKNACMAEADQQNSSDLKILTVVPFVKARVPDCYNWRKYGQKQVKSPKGSRSYYKCTRADCYAKKIECADHSGHVIEVVNKGTHSHDPLRKNNGTSESKAALFSGPALGKRVTDHSVRILKDPSLATMSKETLKETPLIAERKRENSVVSDGNGETQIKDENAGEPELKRRMKKENLACPKTLLKPGIKPKFVVHAAGDVGISGDLYRWRKYGQKTVKGNPHPRNYYRCTSAGCPVRKHIETAVDNPTALIITYKGVHDHDTPVPKKPHGPPSAPLVTAAAPASMSKLQLKRTNTLQSHAISTQWSVGKEGELTSETLDVGADKEKTMESARTLLSIGFEIKPC